MEAGFGGGDDKVVKVEPIKQPREERERDFYFPPQLRTHTQPPTGLRCR